MTGKTRTIELDGVVATALKKRADERGLTVPGLLAELVREDREPIDVDLAQMAELDRRWAAIEAGQPTVSHDKVVRWLETWGTPAFKP
jgi:predicted transcriptional regulator